MRRGDPCTCKKQVEYALNLLFQEGAGPEGSRGARAVFVLDGNYLFVSGFDKYVVKTQIPRYIHITGT